MVRASAAALGQELERHPRHLVLAALVLGLLGPSAAWPALGGAAVLVALGLAGIGRVATLVALGALVAGAAGGQARLHALERTALRPGALSATAVLTEEPRSSPFGAWALARVRGEPVLLRLPPAAPAAPGSAAWSGLSAGDELRAQGLLRPPGDLARARRAHAEWRVRTATPSGRRRGGVAGLVDGVRRRAERALDQAMPADQAALHRGMVLGQDAALPDDLRDAFRASGLSHLVAASGSNVALLAALGLVVAGAAGLGLTGRWAVVLGLIALYVPLAGGGASIQRAGVMGGAGAVALMAGRAASRWYALGLAAAVTLALDPRAAADPGWQLSFAAVVGLLGVARRWTEALGRRRVPAPLAEAVVVAVVAGLATAPLVALRFDRVSLVSLPANVLAAPAVAPVMWLGMLAAAVGQVLPAAAVPLDALAAIGLGYLTWLARTAAGLPGAQISASPLAVAVAAGVAGLGLGWARARRPVAVALVSALLVLAIGVWWGRPRAPGPPAGLRVTFLDVGQGDATLVQSGAVSVLVDTGPPDGGVLTRLRHAGVRRLDLLVVTHAQADHDGGAAAVLAALRVDALLDGRDGVVSPAGTALAVQAARRRVPLVRPATGQRLVLGGLALRVLSPRPEPASAHAGADPNQRAIVLEADAAGRRVLLTADAESDVLGPLALRRVDVLKVSHHGSADPGLPDLLARLRPAVAGIEVGADNTYGHPAPATLTALRSVPTVVRTDRDGSVRLDAVPGGWEVRRHAG